MKLHELLQGIEVLEQNADPELELTGVSYDSRSTAPGELFAAISGYATDGHRFIPAALARGAACVLCEHDMPEHTPWVRVRDARAALAQLGCNWFGHPAERLCMIGVTGTNGKTTVTCLVKHVLEQMLGAKVGLIGTIENRIGDTVVPTERTTPESFALQGLLRQMLDAGCTHVVMEVSSHALALHRVDGIPFTVGAFTNLTEDHLDFHKTMEAYGAAKARLFRLCRTGVLNADDPAYRTMLQGATCTPLLVGTGKDAALRAEQVQLAPDHVAMEVREGAKAAHVRIGIPGRFTVSNALLTLGIARALGIGLEDACRLPLADSLVKDICYKNQAKIQTTVYVRDTLQGDPDNFCRTGTAEADVLPQAETYLREAAGDVLTDAEKEYLPWGAKIITLECGMRFLTDYLQGDVYFKTRRPHHNLDRCRNQLKIVESIESQMNEMKKLLKQA